METTMDFYRLSPRFSISEAAILLIGEDPSQFDDNDVGGQAFPKYKAAMAALLHAIQSDILVAQFTYVTESKFDIIAEDYYEIETLQVNIYSTTVMADDLKIWLTSRGIKKGFFFPETEDAPGYLDRKHPNYSPKLAAAITAWQAVNADSSLIVGKTVKQALMKWLRENGSQFGLTKDDGNPNDQGIEEISKIANWDSKGGAPKTPG